MLPPRRGPPLSLSSCPPLAMGRDGRVCGVGCNRSIMCWASLTCPSPPRAKRVRIANDEREQLRLCAFPLRVSYDHHWIQTKQRSYLRCTGADGGPPSSPSSSSPLGMGGVCTGACSCRLASTSLFASPRCQSQGWVMERFAHLLCRFGRR